MKGCILEATFEGQRWQTILFNIEKEGTTEKGCVKIEDCDTSVNILLRFKKILCKVYLLFYCFLLMRRILKALFPFIP